jgi:hypothetical protein
LDVEERICSRDTGDCEFVGVECEGEEKDIWTERFVDATKDLAL